MGVCVQHWPEGFPMIKRRRFETPRDPPSIFPNVPPSCVPEKSSAPRLCEARKILASRRNAIPDELEKFQEQENLPSWESFHPLLLESELVSSHSLQVSKLQDDLYLYTLDSTGDPCIRIFISPTYTVRCYKYRTPIPIRDLLGFQQRLKLWCQLNEICVRCKNSSVSVKDEVSEMTATLSTRIQENSTEMVDNSTKFLLSQLQLVHTAPTGRRYDSGTLRQSAMLYLTSSSAYNQLRALFPLPHQKTLRTHLACLGEVGTEADSTEMIKTQFQELSGCQRLCVLMFDEMYVKPSLRYRSRHVVGQAVDNKDKMARTILAVMVKPLMGGKPFVIRLLPVYLLSPDLLHRTVTSCIGTVNQCGGKVVALVSDNHPTNRACFGLFNGEKTAIPWIGKNDAQEQPFFLLNDPVHLLKCIRNNWESERDGKMEFVVPDTGKTICADWNDIIQLYKSEEANFIRRTNLTYESCFPSNIQKTNVNLALQVFDDKVVAALKCEGKLDTATFVEHVVKMWKVLNCKSPNLHIRLNDPDRRPISSVSHASLEFLSAMANSFEKSGGGRGRARRRTLTSETGTALVHTLNAIVELCRHLLSEFPFSYVLLAEFHSDPLEAEFGVYRQMSGGNYYVSTEQVLLSARLRRMKLYASLKDASNYSHSVSPCCSNGQLTEEELAAADTCASLVDEISPSEKAELYYVAGYVAHKEKLAPEENETDMHDEHNIDDAEFRASEFTDMVSRGKLRIPPAWLYHFVCLCHCAFEAIHPTCSARVAELFMTIADFYVPQESVELTGTVRRISNCFFKGLVRRQSSTQPPPSSALKERKIRKLSSSQ